MSHIAETLFGKKVPPVNLFQDMDPSSIVKAKLSPGDIAMNDFAGVSTITCYASPLPVEWLEQRTKEIIVANPWLTARIVNDPELGVIAQYSTTVPLDSIAGYFAHEEIPALSSVGISIEEVSQLVAHHLIKKGKDCVDKDERLFKVVVVTTDEKRQGKSFLVFSLSHTLGDGYTFYTIYSMLEKNPFSMNFERVANFQKLVNVKVGEEQYKFFTSPGFVLGILKNMIFSRDLPMQKLVVDLNKISSAKVAMLAKKDGQKEKDKEGQEDDAQFVSTNDVITAWVFNMTQCNYGMMALNMRNRIDAVTSQHAGNYEGSIVFVSPYSSLDIRKMLTKLRYTAADFPSFWSASSGNNCVVSNWVTFHHDLQLPGGLIPVDHYPIGNEKIHLIKSTAIIYKPTKDKIAVLLTEPVQGRIQITSPDIFCS